MEYLKNMEKLIQHTAHIISLEITIHNQTQSTMKMETEHSVMEN